MGQNKKAIFLIVGLLLTLGVILLGGSRVYNLLAKASGNDPQNVQIVQVTANSATVAFTTVSSTQTLVEYGTNPTNLTLFASDTVSTTDHKIALSLLTPATTYYLHIKVGDKVYDNSGLPWTFTTIGVQQPAVTSPTIALRPTTAVASVSAATKCSEIAKRIGAVRGAVNYDPKYDLNSDGIINSADLTLCYKK